MLKFISYNKLSNYSSIVLIRMKRCSKYYNSLSARTKYNIDHILLSRNSYLFYDSFKLPVDFPPVPLVPWRSESIGLSNKNSLIYKIRRWLDL